MWWSSPNARDKHHNKTGKNPPKTDQTSVKKASQMIHLHLHESYVCCCMVWITGYEKVLIPTLKWSLTIYGLFPLLSETRERFTYEKEDNLEPWNRVDTSSLNKWIPYITSVSTSATVWLSDVILCLIRREMEKKVNSLIVFREYLTQSHLEFCLHAGYILSSHSSSIYKK